MTSDIGADRPWHVHHAALRLELGAHEVQVHAVLSVRGGTGALVLDGRGLTTHSVAVDGATLDTAAFEEGERTLTLQLGAGEHTVATHVSARPGAPNDKGFVWGHGLLSTNLEPEGFRRITWFADRPSNRATFDVTLVGDPTSFPVMLCNGTETASGTLDDGRHWVRFADPVPKPSYLFAMVAGDLRMRHATHTTASGRDIALTVAAPPDMIDGADYALWAMAEAMGFDEANGGVEHDLPGLTFVAVPGYPDATEYHGLMFFDPAVLVVDTRGFVDDDLLLVAANVAHEYGHHTRGNRVTVRTWGQLALKEGLTVLTAQNDFRRHMFGPAARVLDVLDLRRLQFPEEVTIGAPVVRGEVSDPTALYNRTTYLKGAEVFGMLRTLLGTGGWREAFRGFVARHDLGAAGVDDFLAVAQHVAPMASADIDGVARWFTTAGRPALRIEPGPNGVTLRRTDALADEPPLAMPVVLGFLDTSGAPMPVSLDGGIAATEHTVVLTGRERTLSVEAPRAFVVSPLRGYSAPVDLVVAAPAEHLATLVQHDTDPFVRWWASEELMIRVVDAHRAGAAVEADEALDVLVAALAEVARTETDPVLLAQILAVPDEFMLGDREPVIDVDGVASGLAHLRAVMGVRLHDDLIGVWHRFHADDPLGTRSADLAVRMLVEPVLAPLLAAASDEGTRLAIDALDSPSATRAMRAFTQLAHVDHVPFDDLVALTWQKWQHSPKLVDRWLRAQSGARRSDTIARVAALASGPLYDRSDRARVMGVWFPFATRNRSVFHHPSGDGYRVFVDELGVLMPENAGLAVRLVGDLLQFKRFDPHRSELLRRELERMASMQGMPDFAVGILQSLLA
ncbi:MAG: aminopeptidase [Actinomycetota bacterium]